MNNPNYMVRDLTGRNSTDRDDRPSYTSMIYGLALGSSEKGFVEVKLLGVGKNETSDFLYWQSKAGLFDVDSEERGIFLPTTVSVVQGDLVVITTTGQTERKMIVTGVAGGGDITAGTINNIQNNQVNTQKRLNIYSDYIGDPILDGTNLLKNSSFSSFDNWDIEYNTSTRPEISLSNDYTSGSYQSIKLVFGKDNYDMTIVQTYDFSNPMFNPNGDNWLVGTLYWYNLDAIGVSDFNSTVSVETNLYFTSNDSHVFFKSDDFKKLESRTSTGYFPSYWGRYRSLIFLDYSNAHSLESNFIKYTNPKLKFNIRISINRKYTSANTSTLYINRPKLEWGGLPTPWTP